MAKIDTSQWQSFVIGDLFEKLDLSIKNPRFNKALDVSEEQTSEFSLPVVNAKHGNNGIMFYGRREDFEAASMALDIVQNGATATGDVYAQPQETGVLWDAYLIKPKHNVKSKNTLLFLAVVIERAIKERFSYDDKCIWKKASRLSVKLPVDSDGCPDWKYMDSFMTKVMEESEACLKSLRLAGKQIRICVDGKHRIDDTFGLENEKTGVKATSKYDKLWEHVEHDGRDEFELSFDEVGRIAGVPIDHSFLQYKKELLKHGYEVQKISLKNKQVKFRKL